MANVVKKHSISSELAQKMVAMRDLVASGTSRSNPNAHSGCWRGVPTPIGELSY
jgi:hypothetical protein